jgi:hypothetical protein
MLFSTDAYRPFLRVLSFFALFCPVSFLFSQSPFPHVEAHAHNDYEHAHPLMDALSFGFTSAEADVHLYNGKLLVGHDGVTKNSPDLEQLYLIPLDSILKAQRGSVYPGFAGCFYLMIDIKTESDSTFRALRKLMAKHTDLLCDSASCAVKIFLSGNRPIESMESEGYKGIALDGRPEDLGKGFSPELMPVVSDNFRNWSSWNGNSIPEKEDIQRIKSLADHVHAEGKMLRLWSIPDREFGWKTLLGAGVDIINTDRLKELDRYLTSAAGRH